MPARKVAAIASGGAETGTKVQIVILIEEKSLQRSRKAPSHSGSGVTVAVRICMRPPQAQQQGTIMRVPQIRKGLPLACYRSGDAQLSHIGLRPGIETGARAIEMIVGDRYRSLAKPIT